MSNFIKVKRLNEVLVLAIERPERKNALTHEMYDFLALEITKASEEARIKALVITGTTSCFTSGNDLEDFLRSPPLDQNSPVSRFMHALMDCPKPVIAAVNGPAVGIGTTMLLHCDLVYAGPDAVFQTPFTRLGLCPEYASSLTMPKLLGHHKAFEMLILGDSLDAMQALLCGLVNQVSEQHLQLALDKAKQISRLPPASVRAGKAMMRQGERKVIQQQMHEEMKVFADRLESPEAREAFSAFMEKRRPDFSKFE